MNKQLLYYYINKPKELNESTLSDIQELVDEYPYFQTARLLLLKNLHILNHIRFEPELKRSVLYIPDRTRLFELIHNLYPVSVTESELAISKEEKAEVVNETLQNGAVDFTFQLNNKLEEKDSTIAENQCFDYEKSGGLEYSLNVYEHSQDVDKNRSFADWLSVVDHYMADNSDVNKSLKAGKKNRTASVIDDFLNNHQSGDKKERLIKTSGSKEITEQSIFDSDDLMTETLAGIYIKQGYYDKAINIFEKLSLKYPEKSVYFAQQIKKAEKLNSNQ